MKKGQPIGRLAMRQENGFWRAYYAMPDTMEGAVFLGSIRMALVMESDEIKTEFMALMKKAITVILKEASDVEVHWPNATVPAPEHERAATRYLDPEGEKD